MKQFLWIVVIAAVIYGYVQLKDYWHGVEKRYPELDTSAPTAAPVGVNPQSLPGLPQGLEASLATAEKGGAKAMQQWLNKCRPYIQDPRLAWIELDYVIMISQEDISEARRVFQAVKDRTPPTSPVYPRVKKLEQTYE